MLSSVSPLYHQRRTVTLNSFEPEELFFSITDGRGVINHANSVFTRLSGYEFNEMQGQPHNIVRDPAMPKGAFHLIWAELLAGRPVASYVANRTRLGARYEVFAVMLPTEGGFISMRLRPEEGGLCDSILDIYDRARGFENTVPGTAREQASAGAKFILEELAKIGIPDMATFTRRALPREIMATVEAVAELEHSAGREPLEILPGKIRMLGRLMMSTLRSLDSVDELSAQTISEVASTQQRAAVLSKLAQVVQEVTETLAWNGVNNAGAGKDLAAYTTEATEKLRRAMQGQSQASAQAAQLHEQIEVLSQNIGVFTLQNQMIGRFAIELLGGAVAEPPGSSMRLLHHTLATQLEAVTYGVKQVNKLAASTPDVIVQAGTRLEAVAAPLLAWANAAEQVLAQQGAEAPATVASQVAMVRAEAQHGFAWPAALVPSAEQLRRVNIQFEEMPLQATVKFIGIVTADID